MLRARKILLADDETNFSATCAEYLIRRGYEVKTVATPEACALALREELMHLLILDLRMRDKDDEKDLSGLTLAKQLGPHIPKIILTAFPTWETAREALTPAEELPPAAFFLSKMEGLAVLHQYVERAFAKHVPLNWDLQITWKDRDAAAFARLLDPAMPRAQDQARADELEDLFRRLFPAVEQLHVERLCWQHPSRAAVQAISFQPGQVPESTLVVLGERAALTAEEAAYRSHAPEGFITTLRAHAAGPLLAANAYTLTGCDFEQTHKLSDLYHTNSGKLYTALTRLIEQVLPDWAHGRVKLEEERRLTEFYRTHPAFNAVVWEPEVLTTRVRTLLRRLPLLGLSAARLDEELVLRFNDGEQRFPHPAQWLQRLPATPPPLRLTNTPGRLDGNAILVNDDAQVWLTDFSAAGFVPVDWNYTALEAALRFEWLEPSHPQRLRELAKCLLGPDFAEFNPRDYDRELHKPLRLIQTLRQAAQRQPGHEVDAYQQALFFHALQKLATNDAAQANNSTLKRLTHALLSAGLYVRQLAAGAPLPLATLVPQATGLKFDARNFAVRVEGRRVSLTKDEFKLLSFLYDHVNEVCPYGEIFEHVVGPHYRGDKSQIDALQQRVKRLRLKLEPDPQPPRYLQSLHRHGYRLSVQL
jgi:DNA-binding response OmpR family regulator